MIFCMKFGWNLMKTVEGVVFRKSWNRKFCKVHRMTPNQTQGIRHQKYLTYVHCSTPSPKFSSVSLYDQPSLRYSTLRFPIDSYVKISKCHKFFNVWQIVKIPITLYSPTTAVFIVKFGPDQMKTVRGVVFWNFQPIWFCVNKNFKVA